MALYSKDPYDVLGIDENASKSDIIRAYKKVARQCHPDKNPSQTKEATERFQYLTECLNKLMDPASKAAIDKVRRLAKSREVEKRTLSAKRSRLIDELERRERESEVPRKQQQSQAKKTKRKYSPPPEKPKESRGIGYVQLKTIDDMEPKDVRDLFRTYGEVQRVLSKKDEYIVCFARFDDALKAVLSEKRKRNGLLSNVKLIDEIPNEKLHVDVVDDFDNFEASILGRMADFQG